MEESTTKATGFDRIAEVYHLIDGAGRRVLRKLAERLGALPEPESDAGTLCDIAACWRRMQAQDRPLLEYVAEALAVRGVVDGLEGKGDLQDDGEEIDAVLDGLRHVDLCSIWIHF